MGVSLTWRVAAFIWGFAEATLFFVVPDVLLTLFAVKFGWRKAIFLIVYCLSGALLGGAAVYALAGLNFETVRMVVDSVPLISTEMITRVEAEMRVDWLSNMFIGAVTGTPYKVYAIAAPGAEITLATFLMGSALVRPFRWVLTITFAAIVAAALKRAGLDQMLISLWAAIWIAFYIFYTVALGL